MDANSILTFWFEEITPKDWWRKSAQFDADLRRRFDTVLQAARRGELKHWCESASGCLALVIVLDQFSRNIYRDKPEAFAADAQALAIAQLAVNRGFDKSLPSERRNFLYMPYMHSEDADIHVEAVALFASLAGENSEDFELRHKAIIDRFGRYPHRNKILGRTSTAEELVFLQEPGSAF
ncbi:DUF924 family protein [Simiduia litorea]|uniref:DUF924 family protein n=1 Tax=Simiduia litorea TaxID=1435348 RepID=UPI0036F427B0